MKRSIHAKELLLLCLLVRLSPESFAADLELYPTFENMGVICTLNPGDDPDGDAVVSVFYRVSGGIYQPGFPLSRVTPERFVGSLFDLSAGTEYEVRISIADPDGDPADGIVLNGTLSTRDEITIPGALTTYTASPDGSGTACSSTAPCSLSQAISSASAGDHILMKGGTYNTGNHSMPRSGTEHAPIVIRAYPGETPVLDGEHPGPFSWSSYAGGVYRTLQAPDEVHYLLADGYRLFPYTDLGTLVTLDVDNKPGFFQDATGLYVHLANGTHPGDADIVISGYNMAFLVEQDYIYFVDVTFKHYGQGSYPKVLYLNNASNCLIQGCTFAYNDLGIGIKRDSHRNVIQNNEFYDVIFDWPWSAIKDVGGLEDGGITFYDPVDGRGNVIRRNTFHDDFDGFNVCPATTSALTNETDVYDNQIYRMGDDGVETDGRCSNLRIIGNTFHDVLMGISLAPVYDGPVYAIRNLIYRTGVGNNDFTGSPFKFNGGYGLSGQMFLFHNTCDAYYAGNNGLYIKTPGTWITIHARNNVWRGTLYGIENVNADQPTDFDYDAVWNDQADDLIRWDNVRYEFLDGFSSAIGQEINGVETDPTFKDRDAGNFTLSGQSELIDRGVLIPGINGSFSGLAPDIGAFEFHPCECDFPPSDGDVDGSDLSAYLANPAGIDLDVVANNFGRTDCLEI